MSARLNVNINDETAAALKELAAAEDLTVTELVRRSVSVYKYLHDNVLNDKDKKLQIVDEENGKLTEVALIR